MRNVTVDDMAFLFFLILYEFLLYCFISVDLILVFSVFTIFGRVCDIYVIMIMIIGQDDCGVSVLIGA